MNFRERGINKKMKIGVWIDDINSFPEYGGEYSYYQALLTGINHFEFDESLEIVNVVIFDKVQPEISLKKKVIFIKRNSVETRVRSTLLKKSHWTKYLKFLSRNSFLKVIYEFFKKKNNDLITSLLEEHGVHLLFYPKPFNYLINFPFITVHWDVGHRSTYPFPETAHHGNYQIRERFYTEKLNQALMILCESKAGAKELCKYYQFFEDKIKVMPIFAGGVIHQNIPETDQAMVLSKYGLKEEMFFFYPAQFWALKNHYNLIVAFFLFIQNREEAIKLVLCGSDVGNLDYIKKTIADIGLTDRVILPGFVPDEDLFVFYKKAIAMVFPSFLGPTNMPLIEAAVLKCPVLCSYLEGHLEILGSNALYFNPADVEGMQNSLAEIMEKPFRDSLARSAYEYYLSGSFKIDNSLHILNKLLLEIKPVRETWA